MQLTMCILCGDVHDIEHVEKDCLICVECVKSFVSIISDMIHLWDILSKEEVILEFLIHRKIVKNELIT